MSGSIAPVNNDLRPVNYFSPQNKNTAVTGKVLLVLNCIPGVNVIMNLFLACVGCVVKCLPDPILGKEKSFLRFVSNSETILTLFLPLAIPLVGNVFGIYALYYIVNNHNLAERKRINALQADSSHSNRRSRLYEEAVSFGQKIMA